MKIQNVRRTANGDRVRLCARIEWEDCDRPPNDVYYEVEPQFSDALAYAPHAFAVAALIPALKGGERRLAMEGSICPDLCGGLEVAMGWLHKWHGDARKPLAIEAKWESSAPPRLGCDHAACFFTGGVDSMATLRHNRLRFTEDHPSYIKDGIIICGLEVDQESAFKMVLQSLSVVADDAGMTLLPVYTNVRSLNEDWWFWEFEWEGAVYASVAHALSNRLTSASISSTYDIANMNQLSYGSHPLLDPNYSSTRLQMRHDGITMSRLDKLRLIKDWEVGLQRLRVCNNVERYRADTINCGRCEKCVRTMLGLSALGALDKTAAFPATDLTPKSIIDNGNIHSSYIEACYRELVAPLISQGRQDLAVSVTHILDRHRRELGWRGLVRRFDRRVLGGRLRLVKRLLSASQT